MLAAIASWEPGTRFLILHSAHIGPTMIFRTAIKFGSNNEMYVGTKVKLIIS